MKFMWQSSHLDQKLIEPSPTMRCQPNCHVFMVAIFQLRIRCCCSKQPVLLEVETTLFWSCVHPISSFNHGFEWRRFGIWKLHWKYGSPQDFFQGWAN